MSNTGVASTGVGNRASLKCTLPLGENISLSWEGWSFGKKSLVKGNIHWKRCLESVGKQVIHMLRNTTLCLRNIFKSIGKSHSVSILDGRFVLTESKI